MILTLDSEKYLIHKFVATLNSKPAVEKIILAVLEWSEKQHVFFYSTFVLGKDYET